MTQPMARRCNFIDQFIDQGSSLASAKMGTRNIHGLNKTVYSRTKKTAIVAIFHERSVKAGTRIAAITVNPAHQRRRSV